MAKSKLRALQIKVLRLLEKGARMDRATMYKSLGFRQNSGLNDVLGKNDPEKRAQADLKKYPSLLTLKYIRCRQVGGDGEVELQNLYEITPAGRKALEKISE